MDFLNLITIELAPLAGKRIKITVEPNATVFRVKQLFHQKEEISPECIKLSFLNRELQNHEYLDVLGIVNNSTLFFRLFVQTCFFQIEPINQPIYQTTCQNTLLQQ